MHDKHIFPINQTSRSNVEMRGEWKELEGISVHSITICHYLPDEETGTTSSLIFEVARVPSLLNFMGSLM